MQKFKPLAFFVLFFFCHNLWAAEEGSTRYRVYWSGIPIGQADVGWRMDEKNWRLDSLTETSGLIGWFSPFTNRAWAEGVMEQGQARPLAFDGITQKRDETRHYTLRYDGNMPHYADGPQNKAEPDPPGKRPNITEAERQGAVDILTFFWQASLHAATQDTLRTWKIYDGKRLYAASLTPAAPTLLTRWELRMKPLNGLTTKEWKRYHDHPWQPARMEIAKRHHHAPPTRLEVPTRFGHLIAIQAK
jgi:hypothetical protein